MQPLDDNALDYAAIDTSPRIRQLAKFSFFGSLLTPFWIVGLAAIRMSYFPRPTLPIVVEFLYWVLLLGPSVTPAAIGMCALVSILRSRGRRRGYTLAALGVVISLGVVITFLVMYG